jgi:hypothetical protein
MHSHGETNVTVGAGGLPNVGAMTTNINKANGARFIAPAHITLRLLCEATSNLVASPEIKRSKKRFGASAMRRKINRNRRKRMPEYALWEINTVMKITISD